MKSKKDIENRISFLTQMLKEIEQDSDEAFLSGNDRVVMELAFEYDRYSQAIKELEWVLS